MRIMKKGVLFLLVVFLWNYLNNAPLTISQKVQADSNYSYASYSMQTTTGTLEGTIIDQQNNPLEGVEVTVTNRATGFSFGKQRTDSSGLYRIDLVPPGEYDITATRSGYQPNTLPNFLVELNRNRLVKVPPISLAPINAAPPPPINLPTAVVDSSDATIRSNTSAEFITALPLPGARSFDAFALLVPGVAPSPATINGSINGPGIGSGVGTAGQFSVNGQRARANNFTIDGSDNNDQDVGVRRQGFTLNIPQTIESIAEFQISTLLADAEAGRNTGGQINVVSQTGSNSIHGQLYDFFTDSTLNARDFFDLTIPGRLLNGKSPYTRNQLGGVFAAPIIKDRAHIFTAFERQDSHREQETHFAVPTALARFNALKFGRQVGYDPLFGQDVLGLYPLPNNPGGPYGDNTFTQLLNASGQGTLFAIRFDYQLPLFGKPTTFTSRYNFTDDNTHLPTVAGAINSGIKALTRTQNIALALESTISSSLSNQFRFSYGRTALSFTEVTGNPFLFQSPQGLTGPIGRLVLTPFSDIGVDPFTFPQGRTNNTFQFADTFISTYKGNTIKFGADIRRVQFNSFLDRNYRTQLSFTSDPIASNKGGPILFGNGLDLAGLGLPSNIQQTLALVPDSHLALRFTEYNLFINDNFHLHKHVTLDFGLRYELNTVPVDATNRIEQALALQTSDFSSQPFAKKFFNSLAAQQDFLAGRHEIYQGDHNNFAPRIGLAWDITGKGNLALRGGYGLFYDQILGNIISQSRNLFPTFLPVNFGIGANLVDIPIHNPAFISFGNTLPLISPHTLNTLGSPLNSLAANLGNLIRANVFALSFTLPANNLRTPYVHQYSVALEKTLLDKYLLSAAYVGTNGRNLIRFRTPNGGQLAPVALITGTNTPIRLLTRPNPLLGPITTFESSAHSDYNALQLSLTRRSSNGFGLQLAYTYAHAIDEVSDIFDLGGSFALAQNELAGVQGLKAERGNANFDLRHRFTAGWSYSLPTIANNKYLQGLQLSGILTLQTGQPYTVNTSIDINQDGNLTDRLNTIKGLIFSDSGRTRIRLASGTSLADLRAQFEPQSPHNGSLGRNTFRAQGIASLDMALAKRVNFNNNQTVDLRIEAFNLLNHTNFGLPVRILEAPGFGSSVTTSVPARTVQFSLRYSF